MSAGPKISSASIERHAHALTTATAVGGKRKGGAAFSLARVLGLDALTTAMGQLSILVASSIVVTVAVVSASLVSYTVWWLATDVMPPHVMPISAVVAAIVATPIASYLVSIIHTLAQSRAELSALSEQLMVARDEARNASHAKSQFLASTSHELRTPLNAIIGFSEIIANELFGPCGEPRYADYAKDIHNSGTHLLHVINEVLDLSRIESGQEQIDTQAECDLTLALFESLKIVGILAEKAGVRLCVPDVPAPILVRANERMMRQILLNLLSNAVKFTPEGGTVTARIRMDDSTGVIVEVADTGIGMSDDEITVAMQPFGQIDSKLSRLHEGTGLGLPLAKAMVELHGGTLTIRSIPHEGTTVTVTVPKERMIEKYAPLRAVG